jgi:hypothetical protein
MRALVPAKDAEGSLSATPVVASRPIAAALRAVASQPLPFIGEEM